MRDTEELPFSPACERNKAPILDILRSTLPNAARVFELGSGTGQHACYFMEQAPQWHWQCSDLPELIAGLRRRLQQDGLNGKQPAPIAFDAETDSVPSATYDAVYTANTLHIMPVNTTARFLSGLASTPGKLQQFICYGPFRIDGRHTSASNADFDNDLRARGCGGIRDVAEIEEWLAPTWQLDQRHAMPANNLTLVFTRAG